jgi:D-alanyl-D-alanine carboxypeptidase (penicillin-binding protein 5/6)
VHDKKRSKLIVCLLLFSLCFSSFLPVTHKIQAQEINIPDIKAEAAVLMEFSSGDIIFSKNGSKILFPASLTKIMTLLLCYEAIQDGRVNWEDEVVVSQKAWETGGSQMFLEIGQRVSFKDLITGISTISANDACVAVAEHLYGSEALFAQEMNKKAQELGLINTHFQNASGLHHPEHYTTAEDLAYLSRYFIDTYPEALKVNSQKEFTFNNIPQYNRNPLLGRFTGADGLKTGHTSEAGHCLVGTALQNGMRFITVVLKNASPSERLQDSETMLNYAFRNYTLYNIFSKDEIITTINVSKGKERQTELIVGEPVAVIIPFNRQDDLETTINAPKSAKAPLKKGEALGSVEVYLDGKLLNETPLITAKEIGKANIFTLFFRSIGNLFSSIWSKTAGRFFN